MKLRQKSKRDQALDAVASMAKTWSEWRLGERVSKTATKGAKKASKRAAKAAKTAKKSSLSGGGKKRKPMKVAGVIALVGGVGAAVAKKLTGGGKAEPLYTPPGPAPETALPPVAPVGTEGLTQPPAVNVPVEPSAEDPGIVPTEREASPGQELAPEPETLISDTAPEGASEDDDAASVDEATERP